MKSLKFDAHDLASEELRHVYQNKSSSTLLVFFNGFVAACLIAWDIGVLQAGIWYIVLLIANFWHWWLGRLDWLSSNISIELTRINRHIIAAAIAGLGWGVLAVTLPLLSRPGKTAIVIIMLTTVILSLPRLVVFLPIFFAFTAGLFLPLLLAIPFLDFETMHMVLVLLIVVAATIWTSAREVRKILISVMLKRVSSEHASWEDRLTGIGNRRRFDANLENSWVQASRAKVPLSIMMVDVDFFKKFNDTYGHQAGDACLKQVASALDGCARRAVDSVTRYGGEEFAVILFHTPLNEARNIGESMLSAVRKLNIQHEQSPHGIVTISMGLTTTVPQVEGNMQALIEEADKSLYQAKENGRNRLEWKMLNNVE